MPGWSPLTKSGHALNIRMCLKHSLLCGFHCPVDWKHQLYTLFYVAVQHLLVPVSLESETLLSLVSGLNKTSEAISVNFPVCPMIGHRARSVRLSSGQSGGNRGPRNPGQVWELIGTKPSGWARCCWIRIRIQQLWASGTQAKPAGLFCGSLVRI